MNSTTNTTNYCLDSTTRRSSVLSPPLTPFDNKRQGGYSPYRPTYSMDNYHHHWMNHSPVPMQQHYPTMYPPPPPHHYQMHYPSYPSPIPTHHHHHHHHQQQQQQQILQPPPPPIHNNNTNKSTTTRKQPSKKNKHSCTFPECLWSFKRFEHLKRHMLVHTGERPHTCPHPSCGKKFSRSDNFHAHYRTHEKKAFATKKNSNSKEEITTFPNMYTTPTIPFSPSSTCSSTSSSTTKKPHACHDCDKKFRRLEHLKRHGRIHTHEQPFPCNYPGCLKAFSRSDNLTQHKKTHERRGTTDFMQAGSFTLVDFIRDGWQGDDTTSTVEC